MILFTMKILGYSAGSYNVEYIPNNTRCSPIKLSIQLDSSVTGNRELVLQKLKASSPQDYWSKQLDTQISNASSIAAELINTSHVVREPISLPVNPVATNFNQVSQTVSSFPVYADQPPPTMTPPPTSGQSTPEQVAGIEEQNIIKLKIFC